MVFSLGRNAFKFDKKIPVVPRLIEPSFSFKNLKSKRTMANAKLAIFDHNAKHSQKLRETSKTSAAATLCCACGPVCSADALFYIMFIQDSSWWTTQMVLITDQVIPQTFYVPSHIAMDFAFHFRKKIAKRNFCMDSFWSCSKNNFVLFSHELIFMFETQSKNSTTVSPFM